MKVIRVTMPDGSEWEVPASVVAKSRAEYFSEYDEDCTYDEEYEFTIGSEFELKDWAENNMNWEDVREFSVQVVKGELMKNVDYQKGWMNGVKKFMESDHFTG